MKSLELQGASAGTDEANIDAIRQDSNPQGGKCGLNHGKKCPAYGTRCWKCKQCNHWQQVCRNKQAHVQQTRSPPQPQFDGQKKYGKEKQTKVHMVEETNSDFEELFENIKIDSTGADVERNEAFAHIKVTLPNLGNTNALLKVKVDTVAKGNILPLRIYGKMFPDCLDENGLPRDTTPSQTKLTAYNGTSIPQHGICSVQCSYDSSETEAKFYVADGDGPAVCGLPTSYKLKLVQLHCEINTSNNSVHCPVPAIHSIHDLQKLYPDRFNGIGKFEGEYHIAVDPDVPSVVHAPRKCPIHIKDDMRKELDEIIGLGVIKPVTEPNKCFKCCLLPKIKWEMEGVFRSQRSQPGC